MRLSVYVRRRFGAVVMPVLLLIGVSACADGGLSGKPVPPLSFACPVGISAAMHDARGRRWRTDWLGADPSDPNLCLDSGPRARRLGEPEKRMFARWGPDTVVGTTEEVADFRERVDAFLHGRAPSAQFILRGAGFAASKGQQTIYQMTIKGMDTVVINDRPVDAVKIRINYTFGGNNATWWSEVWHDPETKLWVKSVGSLELGPEFTWSVDRVFKTRER